MADFKKALSLVLFNEGNYGNIPGDAGGETYKGIARNENPIWMGWARIQIYKDYPNFPKCLDLDMNLQWLVEDFYKRMFWDRLRGDEINNQDIANELFDSAVNTGVVPSIKMMQAAGDVDANGRMNDATLNALNA